MMELLRSAKAEKDQNNGKVDVSTLIKIEWEYEHILPKGYQVHPNTKDPNSSRGRPKQHLSKNLLDRFCRNRDTILALLTHEEIPFDNNQAKRDIRMAKVKQKVSGSFCSDDGDKLFGLTRSFIHTAQKQGKPIFHSIKQIIREGKVDFFSV